MTADPYQQAFELTVAWLDEHIDRHKVLIALERDLRHRAFLTEQLGFLRVAREAVYARAHRDRPIDRHVPGQMAIDDQAVTDHEKGR